MIGKKYSYEYVKSYIEKEGYQLLSDTYKNIHTKLELLCPLGHKWNAPFNTFKKRHRCSICSGNKKMDYEYIKSFIEKEGYTLLSNTYKNNKGKLSIECPNGHIYNISFDSFQQGHRCFDCRKHTIKDFKKMIEKGGYTLLSDDIEYKDVYTKFNVKCPEGHEWETCFKSFETGHRCNKCVAEKRKHDYDYVKKYIESYGYFLLSDSYKGSHDKLKIKCPLNHEYDVKWYKFLQGNRCPICNKELITSNAEREIVSFIKESVNNVITNDREQIDPYELDMYIPDYKIAIEYNGLYWHSEQQGKNKNYHLNKTLKCKEKGIQLIHIFEDEWLNRPDVVKSVILSKLGIFERRIYARKCHVQEISSSLKNEFLKKYHLQGKDNATYSIGLFNGFELLSVMTFGKRSISGANGVNFELLRYCNKLNVQILGGASKMIKYFIKRFDPPYIKTFADLRYSDGKFYNKIGFNLKHISNPNYWYIIDGQRKHRVGYQKHKLKDKLDPFDPNKTEYENMLTNNIDRIWDCGNYVFEYKNS